MIPPSGFSNIAAEQALGLAASPIVILLAITPSVYLIFLITLFFFFFALLQIRMLNKILTGP